MSIDLECFRKSEALIEKAKLCNEQYEACIDSSRHVFTIIPGAESKSRLYCQMST